MEGDIAGGDSGSVHAQVDLVPQYKMAGSIGKENAFVRRIMLDDRQGPRPAPEPGTEGKAR